MINVMHAPIHGRHHVHGARRWREENREVKHRLRKKYTIRNPRQQWTQEEHQRFVEAIKLYKRDWARVRAHVGTRTVIQIRSHAQKYFLKLQKLGKADCIPPRRNKISSTRQPQRLPPIQISASKHFQNRIVSAKRKLSSHQTQPTGKRSRIEYPMRVAEATDLITFVTKCEQETTPKQNQRDLGLWSSVGEHQEKYRLETHNCPRAHTRMTGSRSFVGEKAVYGLPKRHSLDGVEALLLLSQG
ncbi:hypothetical protein AAMO2058_001216700 [Amorphochlora amoebiformis]|uniref:Uncharacterized protein n=1 Tax=Amorphochlora amoebiformis TaxID=1561963 RepID=A0A7S0D0C8_9EUKA|mmetsp:Transcript_16953/g.26929  ORF Transcript_16953/g.26929 Transcript_16953/m.26929 type:complete len:244 (+) Transcript_16953:283-1014(+)